MFDISPLRPTYFLLAEPQTSPNIAPPSFFYKLGGAKLHSTSKAWVIPAEWIKTDDNASLAESGTSEP